MKRWKYLIDEALAALYILTVLIGWPINILILARKAGVRGFFLGVFRLATYILMVVRGGGPDGQA